MIAPSRGVVGRVNGAWTAPRLVFLSLIACRLFMVTLSACGLAQWPINYDQCNEIHGHL